MSDSMRILIAFLLGLIIGGFIGFMWGGLLGSAKSSGEE